MGILDRIAGRVDQLVAGDGDSQARARHEVESARGLVERGDLESAALAFGRAVDGDAFNPDGWIGLAETLGSLGRFEPARDAFRRALTLPLSPERRASTQAALGRLYAKAGQLQKAIRELRKAIAARPDDADSLATLGRALIGAGEQEGATFLERAGRIWPDDSTTGAGLLVEAADATEDHGAAERLLREAIRRAPGDAMIRTGLARYLVTRGRIAEALAEARAAAEACPDQIAPWMALRQVNASAGDYRAALEAARRERAMGAPPPFAVWLTLALGTQDRGAIEEAMQHGVAGEANFSETRAMLDGRLRPQDGGVASLARAAPTPSARRFVVRTLALPPVPVGNLYAVLAWAEALAAGQPALLPLAVPLARAVEALDRPLLVAVMGEFNVGKSSFVNALAGDEIAPVGITPTTATINVLRYGAGGGRAIYHDGTARELGPRAIGPFLKTLTDADAQAIRQVEIFAPVEALRRVEIVDTPGLNSLRQAHERVARDFLIEADAIVWVFAAGQAAKATEREALVLAHAAGKHVLGVINKVDRASVTEIDEVVRHVQLELGELVQGLVPLSARAALAARARGDVEGEALRSSGWPALEAALESGFFGRARELKRGTALAALARFVDEARAILPASSVLIEDAGLMTAARAAVDMAEQGLRSALAAERIDLRSRLDGAFRAAAFEVRELVRPRAWLFGEHRADPEDETFLRDVLDDLAGAATDKTRLALLAVVPAGDTFLGQEVPDLVSEIAVAVERFRAYARGIIEGAAAVFFRVDLPRIRLDAVDIHHALGRWSPDPEEALFRPVERAIEAFLSRARANLDERERDSEITTLMRRELLVTPLDALADAISSLERKAGTVELSS